MLIAGLVLAIILAFILLLCVRAAVFLPPKAAKQEKSVPHDIDFPGAIENLRAMIRLKTVKGNTEAFLEFKDLLPKLYPLVHSNCERHLIGTGGLVYHYKGESDKEPTILMSHYDVVPADENEWEKPPFSAEHIGGEIWGRGTLDTKGTLCAILETAEALIRRNFVPKNDIYFAFGHDEETDSTDAPAIVSWLESKGVRPALVLDEGGAVVEKVFPGVKSRIAVIGTGEKGGLNIKLTYKADGGHSSMPPKRTPIGQLAKAVVTIEKKPFRAVLAEPVKEMFDTLGRHSSFGFRLIFANMWCLRPLFFQLCKQMGGELNALVRTTVAFTQMQGSSAHNVLPPVATVGANLRLMRETSPEDAASHFKKHIKNDKIELTWEGENAPMYSKSDSEGFRKVACAINKTWPDAIVTPYLMRACTDSRHYRKICDVVLRFSAAHFTQDDLKRIHGNNERITEGQFNETLEFYQNLMLDI